VQEFPPASKLNPKLYGDQTSSIREAHIENRLDGLTINEVVITIHLFKPNLLKYDVFKLYVNNQTSLFRRQFKK